MFFHVIYCRQLFCLSTRYQTRKVTIQHNSSHQRNFIQSRITQRTDNHQETSQVVNIQSGSYFQMFLNFIFFQPDWCSDVRSWYAKNSTDCSACVRCLSRSVFLGIFVFQASLRSIHPVCRRKHTEPLFAPLANFAFLEHCWQFGVQLTFANLSLTVPLSLAKWKLV